MLSDIKLNLLRRRTLLALASLGVWDARAASAAMTYRYWDWGRTPRRDDYQVAALTLALDKTRAAYGAFTVERVLDSLSTMRVRREVYAGRHLNVHAGPWRDVAAGDPQERNILISTPILSGLLGYRVLIVRKLDLPRFQAITSQAQLRKIPAGQGRGWLDAAILRHNGYKVEDSGNVATLLEMLLNKRFDYLPTSIVEAPSLLTDDLAIVPDLVLYYPLPAVFYVSAAEPKLAERLEVGLAAARRDGSLDALTARHFQKEIKHLKSSAVRCLVLANPNLPKDYPAEPPLPLRKSSAQ
ncbi:hypothetical protein [Duganella sp.]|uniref:hypothetical protein n=1 Tax=Duganella sp. TaxID=1904440 RepID=UPI0031D9B7DA